MGRLQGDCYELYVHGRHIDAADEAEGSVITGCKAANVLLIPLILIVNSPMGDKAAEGPRDYSPSGGAWVPADLNYGHLDGFFFLLAALMCCNTYVAHVAVTRVCGCLFPAPALRVKL